VPALALVVWFAAIPVPRPVKAISPFIVQYLYETDNVDTVDVDGAVWSNRTVNGYGTGTAWDWASGEWVTILRKPAKPKYESQSGRFDRSRYKNNGRPDDSRNAKAQQSASNSYRKVLFSDGSIRFVDVARNSEPRRAVPTPESASADPGAGVASSFSGLSMDSRSIIGDLTTANAVAEKEKRALGQNSPAAEGNDSTEGEQPSELTAGTAM